MIGNSVIMELIADTVLWYYLSYDHKKAVEEAKRLDLQGKFIGYPDSCYNIPDALKAKFVEWKTGKLRLLKFDSDGMIFKLYIGRSSRYAKGFFPNEVGTIVKPILNINGDKYGLIATGLAVDESQINL
jgi:hypothetical protein